MTFDEILKTRRSVRSYQNKDIPQEVLNAVLEAGRLAPSARNRQEWHFTVVKNKPLRKKLVAEHEVQEMVAEAPALLVVWQHGDRGMQNGQSAASVDCAIAMTCMLLKATELGLASCWMAAYPADAVKDLFSLPDEAVVVAISPLGYAAEAPEVQPRKPLEEVSSIL